MPSPLRANSIAPILTREDSDAGDWGGDLMDVNADADDWDSFETGAAPEPTLSTSVKPKKPSAKSTLANAPPLSTKKVMPSIANTTNGALKLGSSGRTRDNPLLKELGMFDSSNLAICHFDRLYVQKRKRTRVTMAGI